ncbi:MAG TPA: class I SAM-dependent methyltransferase [Streptosporangiaceae bacterium]|nr:class I SAM-dependent methyltransferase [Streptosporangiaceae bacterium]
MSEVHEIAAQGFGAEAAAYDRARPSYPPDAISWLIEKLRLGPGSRIVDLAAGTGKLTRLLTDIDADLIAMEPVAAMRAKLREQLPQVPVLAGVAEALPLADSSIDAVLVAQAFHWFDARRAMAEIARAVRPGGHLALIWNARDRSIEWVDQVWSVMDRVERNAPWRDEGDGHDSPAGIQHDGTQSDGTQSAGTQSDGTERRSERYLAGPGDANWSPWTEGSFFHVQYSTHDDVIDRMRSVSHIAALPPPSQRGVLDEIRTILAEHPQTRQKATVGIPYRVDAMFAERLS